jgi:hypothetical protein
MRAAVTRRLTTSARLHTAPAVIRSVGMRIDNRGMQTSTLGISEAPTAVCRMSTAGIREPMAPPVHLMLAMLNTIALTDLSTVVGGVCTCSQQAPAPCGTQQAGTTEQPQPQPQPTQQPTQQPAQQPQCRMSCEQVLQAIASLLGQFTKQSGGQPS